MDEQRIREIIREELAVANVEKQRLILETQKSLYGDSKRELGTAVTISTTGRLPRS